MPTTQLLSNHYNRTRTEYYRQLAAASATQDPREFLHYAVEGFVDELRAQLDRIWSMQYVDRWEQFVYETFGEIRGVPERRRLRLVKDISRASILPADGVGLPELVPIPRRALRHLSPQLAELYAGTTERTLTRDLDELVSRRLIERTEAGYVPASYQVYSFMPPARGSLTGPQRLRRRRRLLRLGDVLRAHVRDGEQREHDADRGEAGADGERALEAIRQRRRIVRAGDLARLRPTTGPRGRARRRPAAPCSAARTPGPPRRGSRPRPP